MVRLEKVIGLGRTPVSDYPKRVGTAPGGRAVIAVDADCCPSNTTLITFSELLTRHTTGLLSGILSQCIQIENVGTLKKRFLLQCNLTKPMFLKQGRNLFYSLFQIVHFNNHLLDLWPVLTFDAQEHVQLTFLHSTLSKSIRSTARSRKISDTVLNWQVTCSI